MVNCEKKNFCNDESAWNLPVSILGMQPHATLLTYQFNCVEASLGLAIMWCKHPCRDQEAIPTSPANWEANPLEYDCMFFSNFLGNTIQWDYNISLQGMERFAYFICTSQSCIAVTNIFWTLPKKIKFCFHFTITAGRSFRLKWVTSCQMNLSAKAALRCMTEITGYSEKSLWIHRSRIRETRILKTTQGQHLLSCGKAGLKVNRAQL